MEKRDNILVVKDVCKYFPGACKTYDIFVAPQVIVFNLDSTV